MGHNLLHLVVGQMLLPVADLCIAPLHTVSIVLLGALGHNHLV